MTNNDTFSLNEKSTVLTPDAPGIYELLDCMRHGKTIAASQSARNPISTRSDESQWLLCETSGSSGQPKVIRRKPETWTKSFAITAERFSISPDDTYATLGALGHSLTLFATVEALSLGADICALANLGPQRQVRALTDFGVSVVYATPTQLGLLVKGAALAQVSVLPNVRYVFSGGGKLDAGLKDALHVLFPAAQVHEFFGASETSFITISDNDTPQGSVGRLYPGVQMTIDAPQNATTGELWVSSPYLFDGYDSGDHQDTRWNGAYLSIGEMGHLDANGYLFLSGRKNRMVTISDTNVFPEEVERCVIQLDDVEHCSVISARDEKRGNRLICFVQSSGGAFDPTVIRDHCRATLGQHSVPKEIRFIEQMPTLAAGKPDLQKLREMIGAH
ncbi:AMP-binding protein [Yoonia maritima]|uniref:AMP-binding protein n=1 Tax=Yoonia maritima TaxID=1435347 RepID=UPI003736CDD3